ncbi:MAG: TauD/TfdA family dioxygenase [Pseudomonadota bacterium]
MRASPMSEAVGVEIRDLDLRHLTDSAFADIRDLFHEHGMIAFRDQELTPEDHIAFAERWGEIDINRFFHPVAGHPQIAEVLKEPDQTSNIGGGWHTDHSYDQVPAMGSILKAVELPATGGDTKFAGMSAAYDGLSDDLKAKVEHLEAHHGSAQIFGTGAAEAANAGDRFGNADAAVQEAVHPVVLIHPETGRRGLYVNAAFTTHIIGMDEEESRTLLFALYAHCAQGEYHTTLKWRPGTVAMWDNRSTWHWALNDYHGQRRYMHRITVKGVPLR